MKSIRVSVEITFLWPKNHKRLKLERLKYLLEANLARSGRMSKIVTEV